MVVVVFTVVLFVFIFVVSDCVFGVVFGWGGWCGLLVGVWCDGVVVSGL